MTEDAKVNIVNNTSPSLFSNVEVFLSNDQVYTSNGLYPHKALISNEFSHTRGTKESTIQCHGYNYEPNPDRHVQVHAHILSKAIDNYWAEETKSLLNVQKDYCDSFYNWDLRINQWNSFLKGLRMGIEERNNDST